MRFDGNMHVEQEIKEEQMWFNTEEINALMYSILG